MRCKVAILLVLSLLTEALPSPQAPRQTELYKDDNGNYKINYSVETDKGVISVRQHHRNLEAAEEDDKPVPVPIEADPLPPIKKYYPVKSKLLPPAQLEEYDLPPKDDFPPSPPRYSSYRSKIDSPQEDLPPPPPPPRYPSYRSKYLPPPRYTSYRSKELPPPPHEDPADPLPPKYSYGSRIPPPSKAAPPPPEELPPPPEDDLPPPPPESSNYLPPRDADEYREQNPLRKNQVLSGILSQIRNSREGLVTTPKAQRDKLYSMGFLYMKNLWNV